jgi:hypothetical protein
MADTTTGGGLKPDRKSRKVGVLARIGNAFAGKRPAGDPIRDPDGLKALIRADRIRRRMTWPVYAEFLGVKLSTLHKIATGVHRPSELTEAIIRETLDANP